MGDISDGLDRAKLDFLGRYALQHNEFLQTADSPTALQGAVQDPEFIAALAGAGFGPMTREEIAFCSGWLQLANTQFGSNDTALKNALDSEINNGGPNG
jgi:hypothetical protein